MRAVIVALIVVTSIATGIASYASGVYGCTIAQVVAMAYDTTVQGE